MLSVSGLVSHLRGLFLDREHSALGRGGEARIWGYLGAAPDPGEGSTSENLSIRKGLAMRQLPFEQRAPATAVLATRKVGGTVVLGLHGDVAVLGKGDAGWERRDDLVTTIGTRTRRLIRGSTPLEGRMRRCSSTHYPSSLNPRPPPTHPPPPPLKQHYGDWMITV